MKQINERQKKFIEFALYLDNTNKVSLPSIVYTQFMVIKETGVYEESDGEILNLFTKEIFSKEGVKEEWRTLL
jgi:hypothetical protein